MKHGRKDYQRIQDPAANKNLIDAYATARRALNDGSSTEDHLTNLVAALSDTLERTLQAPPEHPIADDEPVFLLRASDKIAPALVREYAMRLRQEGGGTWDHSNAVIEQAKAMELWQSEHQWKLPDAPAE